MDFRDIGAVAIVGSRQRTDRDFIEAVVDAIPAHVRVVSGGCKGVDTWAIDRAIMRGLKTTVHQPDMTGVRSRGEAARWLHERNQVVVDDVDAVIAFVASSREGGTEDTIRRAIKAQKPVELR